MKKVDVFVGREDRKRSGNILRFSAGGGGNLRDYLLNHSDRHGFFFSGGISPRGHMCQWNSERNF